MNHKTIFLRLAGLKIAKQIRDIRGKKFLQKQQKLKKIFQKFFENQADALIKSLENRANLAGVQVVQKSEWWDDILAMFEEDAIFRLSLDEILQEIYNLGIDTEFKERNAEVGGSFDITNIYSKNYAETRSAELMSGVTETTRSEVRSIFADGWQNSNSLKQISEKIQEKFANFSSWRADLIAMQETSFAYEVGRSDQFAKLSRDTGITGWKRSQSQGDDTVRATHRQNELDGWIPNDEEFSGTRTMHAPHGFRCRCVVVRRLLEPQIDEKLKVYADVDTNLPDEVKMQLLEPLKLAIQKTPNVPRPFIIDAQDFLKNFPQVEEEQFHAVTYWKASEVKIGLSNGLMQWKAVFDNTFSFANNFKNTIIHEMWHNSEIFLRNNFLQEYERVMGVLWEDFLKNPIIQNPLITKEYDDEFQAKRELFAEYFTLFVNNKEIPDTFLELTKFL